MHRRSTGTPKGGRPLEAALVTIPDVLERLVSGRTEAHELERLLPWAWKAERTGTDPKAAA